MWSRPGSCAPTRGGISGLGRQTPTSAEQNYSAGEQELLAVIHALELWRCYLNGVKFTIVTDHSPNTFFATKALLSPRQT